MAVIRSVIRSVGAHLPKRVMTNADMMKIVDTTDEWIVERTGIRARHIAGEDEKTSDLGIAASKQALVRAGSIPSISISSSAQRQRRTVHSLRPL